MLEVGQVVELRANGAGSYSSVFETAGRKYVMFRVVAFCCGAGVRNLATTKAVQIDGATIERVDVRLRRE